MPVTIEIDETAVHIAVTGWAPLLAFCRRLDLALQDIVEARADDVDRLKPTLGLRLGGAYVPGLVTTGRYTVRGRKGCRQLWYVFRAKRVLVVETRLMRPCRVVLQVEDPAARAAEIERRREQPGTA
ncbi:MAG: hypothetical protein JWM05_3789 [Acidimicrobiales bacterium]|nr:hypothetical protein [Acidimicrobiales bacterium]